MANKKINELDSRASLSLSDLLAVGDPTTGYLYKITITDLKSLTGAGVISFNGRVGAVSPAEGDYTLNQLGDVIITSPSNTQLLQYNGSNWVNWTPNYLTAESDTLNSVTGRGNTTTNYITVGGITAGSQSIAAYHTLYSANVNDGSALTIAAENASANSSRSQIMISDLSGGAGKRFGIGVYTGASPYSYLDAATKLVFQQSGGNVIVGGIVDAGYKFDVVGTARIQGNLTFSENGNIITSNQFYASATNYINSIIVGWDAGAVYLGYSMGALPIHIGTNGTGELRFRNTGGLKIDSFVGTGTRILTTDANGVVSASSVLSGYVPYTGATTNVDLGVNDISVKGVIVKGDNSTYSGALNLKMANTINTAGQGYLSVFAQTEYYYGLQWSFSGGTKTVIFTNASIPLNTQRYYTLPNADGMLALTSQIPSITGLVPYTGATADLNLGTSNDVLSKFVWVEGDGTLGGILSFKQYATSWTSTTDHTNIYATGNNRLNFSFYQIGGASRFFSFDTSSLTNNTGRVYTMPNASGTLALTSDLSSYLPLTGGTLSGNLSIVKSSGSAALVIDSATGGLSELNFKVNGSSKGLMYVNESFYQFNNYSSYGYLFKNSTGDNIFALQDGGTAFFIGTVSAGYQVSSPIHLVTNATSYSSITSIASTPRSIVLPDASGTVALTSDLSSYATLGTSQTISGQKTFSVQTNFSAYINMVSNQGISFYNAANTYATTLFGAVSMTGNRTIYFPDAGGTLALTSQLSAYLPNTGASLLADQSLSSKSNYIGQICATDTWKIYGYATVSDQMDMVFEIGDNAAPVASNGQRFRFSYDAANSGTSKDVLILDYNSTYLNTSLGIGTNNPLSQLQVVGTGTVLRIGEASGTTGKQALFGIDATSGRTEIQSVWQGTGFTTLALNPNGGSVGINTNAPAYNLDVNGTGRFTGVLTLGGNLRLPNSLNASAQINFSNVGAEQALMGFPASNNTITFYGATDKIYYKSDKGSVGTILAMNTDGNVGIGTNSPSYKLDVSGSVKATDLRLGTTYNTSYTTSGSWGTNWVTIIQPNTIAAYSVWLVKITYSSGSSPYYVNTAFVWSTASCNGGGADNAFTPMISTHQGGTGLMQFRSVSGTGQVPSGLQVYLSGFASYDGTIYVEATRLT